MKKAFSLVELLVVIAIIGVLGGVLIASLSGGSETAIAARCLSNMKNLASACQTYGMREGHYPLAGNRTILEMDESRGRSAGRVQKRYTEFPGWISANSQGFYPSTSYKKAPTVSMYSSSKEDYLYALTNGAIWKYVSANQNTYICPLHAKKCPQGVKPQWSYLMSAYFGWDVKGASSIYDPRKEYGRLDMADKRLLFSEVPFSGYNTWQPEGEGASADTDAILQYRDRDAGGNEQLGVNHTKGRDAFLHVAFADGHVEKLRVPTVNGKPDTSQMDQLAEWLAKGIDVSYDGKTYRKMDY